MLTLKITELVELLLIQLRLVLLLLHLLALGHVHLPFLYREYGSLFSLMMMMMMMMMMMRMMMIMMMILIIIIIIIIIVIIIIIIIILIILIILITSSFLRLSSSYLSLKASLPHICSSSFMSSTGDLDATDSTSPWKTRKFLAFTRTPICCRVSSYSSYVVSLLLRRYVLTPNNDYDDDDD